MNMASFNVAMWNCAGLRSTTPTTQGKMDFFQANFYKNNPSLMIFLESHHQSKDELPPVFDQYALHYSLIHSPATPANTHTGIIALLHKDYDILKEQNIIDGRLLQIQCKHNRTGRTYNFSILYNPPPKQIRKQYITGLIDKLTTFHTGQDRNFFLGC